MRYNELTYHKASPFYRQGYLPDRAWYNRKPKEFPSEIPTGQDYFTDNGRKHYNGKLNRSEIQETGVLTSPEKYPFQNRIAQDKSYMRSMDTTDIEGAGSGTRVNQAIRYKLRAQQELSRKYNQSLDMRQNREHQYQEKRRELATKQYQTLQEKKQKQTDKLNQSRLSNNPEPQTDRPKQNYYELPRNSNPDARNGDPYIHLLPKQYYSNLQNPPQQPQYINKYIEPPQPSQQRQPQTPPHEYPRSNSHGQPNSHPASPAGQQDHRQMYMQQEAPGYAFNTNDRHKSNPAYQNNYEAELQRRKQDYMRTIEIDGYTRDKLHDKKQFRKHNPTNLSFNLAAQSIVGNQH